MKLGLLTAALAGFVSGCDIPTQRVEEAWCRYQAIQFNSTSNDVYRALGRPQFVDSSGLLHWRTVGWSTNHVAELTVGFNDLGRIWHLECVGSGR